MKSLNRLCLTEYGMSIRDLPDMRFRDSFDDGISPSQFFEEELGSLEQLGELILS